MRAVWPDPQPDFLTIRTRYNRSHAASCLRCKPYSHSQPDLQMPYHTRIASCYLPTEFVFGLLPRRTLFRPNDLWAQSSTDLSHQVEFSLDWLIFPLGD